MVQGSKKSYFVKCIENYIMLIAQSPSYSTTTHILFRVRLPAAELLRLNVAEDVLYRSLHL